MLREQRVIEDTIKYFSELHYKSNLFQIVVITTQREVFEKEQNKARLSNLVIDLSLDLPLEEFKERYLGIFDSKQLEDIWENFSGHDYNKVYRKIEKLYDKNKTTYEIALLTAEETNRRLGETKVKVINYPEVKGSVAHQLNYFIQSLRKEENNNTYIGIYNADSRPNKKILSAVDQQIKHLKTTQGKNPNILQQSSLLLLNFDNFKESFSGYFLKAAALFQSKWILIHEISRLREQSTQQFEKDKKFFNTILKTKVSHCIGHGLFLKLEYALATPFPTNTVIEDIPYGFIACCKRERINPIPLLEDSESPETVKSLFNQKKMWFTGYLDYFRIRKEIINKGVYFSKLEVNILAFKAVFTGVIWFLQSVIFITPLLLLAVNFNIPILFLYIMSIVLYIGVPYFVILSNIERLNISLNPLLNLNLLKAIILSFMGVIVNYTHSFGPINASADYLKIVLKGGEFKRIKTER